MVDAKSRPFLIKKDDCGNFRLTVRTIRYNSQGYALVDRLFRKKPSKPPRRRELSRETCLGLKPVSTQPSRAVCPLGQHGFANSNAYPSKFVQVGRVYQ
jgi:hypothetical protein